MSDFKSNKISHVVGPAARMTLLAAFLFAIAALVFWAQYPVSSQEGLANFAKVENVLTELRRTGGPAWWGWAFQGGTSLAPWWGTSLTSAVLALCAALFGTGLGIKISMLAGVPVAGFGAFLLVRRLSGSEAAGVWAGLAYASSAGIWVRMMAVEHVVVVWALALLPYAAWSLLRLLEEPAAKNALLAAVMCSAVALTYSKAALLAMPVLGALVLWGFWKHCGVAGWVRPGVWGTLLGGVVVLGVLPNLPALRESGFAALFEFGPLEGWKQSFASKSALHFFDRLGGLSGGFRSDFAPTTAAGGMYLGAVLLLAVGMVVVLRRRMLGGDDRRMAGAFRLSCGLALFAFWLSFGPFSVVSGTLRALQASGEAADVFPAVLWGVIGLQGWLIWGLLPERMPLKKSSAILLMAVYFLVPGFGLVSWLPFYRDLRAPFDFYQVGGLVWACAAGGIALAMLLESRWTLARPGIRRAGLAVIAVVWGLDFAGHATLGAKSALPAGTYAEFLDAARFLKDSPARGGVLAMSGRYFYLQVPSLTGRALVQEAFQSYLQQRGYAALLAAGYSSMADFMELLRVAGVRYVLIDREDPDLPKEFAAMLGERLPSVHRSRFFEILENPAALAPAFGASEAVLFAGDQPPDFPAALEAAGRNLLAVGQTLPGESAGTISEGKLEIEEDFKKPGGSPFFTIADVRREASSRISLGSVEGAKWIVVPEAWNPGWTASAGGKSVPVYRALGALLAVENPGVPVEFTYRAPAWYDWCLWTALGGWLVVLPAAFLKSVRREESASEHSGGGEISRTLVVTPTYNEAESLPRLLDRIFAADPALEVLVVDDGSPDGTAGIVRARPEFGKSLHLIERSGKLGLGSAYREGFRWAKDHGYDACAEIDADLSHDPADLPRLVARVREGADVVIGSRYLDGLRVVNWPEHRLLISSFATQFVRFFTGIPLTDATSGFKVLRLSALDGIDWNDVRAEGYAFQVELHHALWKSGARIEEVPITFTEREEGKTKMSAAIALEAMSRVVELGLNHKR